MFENFTVVSSWPFRYQRRKKIKTFCQLQRWGQGAPLSGWVSSDLRKKGTNTPAYFVPPSVTKKSLGQMLENATLVSSWLFRYQRHKKIKTFCQEIWTCCGGGIASATNGDGNGDEVDLIFFQVLPNQGSNSHSPSKRGHVSKV